MLTIGERVRQMREERLWTIADLCFKCRTVTGKSLSDATIRNIETGRHLPTLRSLRILAGGFGVSIEDLTTGVNGHE